MSDQEDGRPNTTVSSDPRQVIKAFLAEAIVALGVMYQNKVRVAEFHHQDGMNGYSFIFRGYEISVSRQKGTLYMIRVGRTDIAEETPFEGMVDSMVRACQERLVFQHSDDEDARRAKEAKEAADLRQKAYEELATSLSSALATTSSAS